MGLKIKFDAYGMSSNPKKLTDNVAGAIARRAAPYGSPYFTRTTLESL